MDIISEILNADKIAEEKLRLAEKKKAEIIRKSKDANDILIKNSEENIKLYEKSKSEEVKGKIAEFSVEIEKEEQQKIQAMDNVFNLNREKWVKDIFDRIISM